MPEDEDIWGDCSNCGDEITMDEYNRTGTDEYCEECSDDPRGQAFGHWTGDTDEAA